MNQAARKADYEPDPYDSLYEQALARHLGRWIAITSDRLYAADDRASLERDLRADNVNRSDAIVQFLGGPPPYRIL